MRLSVSLDDDLYRMAKAYALTQGISLSRAVNALLRRAFEAPTPPPGAAATGPLSDFPVSACSRRFTPEEVASLDDDEDRRLLAQPDRP